MIQATLRPARIADTEELIRLDTTAPREPVRAGMIRHWVAEGECFVAEVDGQLAGYAVLNDRFFHQGNVDMLMIHPDFRRQGIGRCLLRRLAGQCPTEKIWVTTNLSNQPMQRLLASEGFTLSGYIDNLDESDPELVFFKRLARAAN